MTSARPRGDPHQQHPTDRVADLAGLLSSLGCQTVHDLDLMLYAAFDLEPFVAESAPEYIVVAVRNRGVEVGFPCRLADFWDSVTCLEREARQRLEEAPDDG